MEAFGSGHSLSSQRISLHNIFIIGEDSYRIFCQQASMLWGERTDMGIFAIIPSSEGREGFCPVSENQIDIHIGGAASLDGFRDLVEVRNAFGFYQEAIQEMVFSSHVNIIVSSLGDPFAAGVTPEIAQLSSKNGAVTIGVLSLPHPDEGNRYMQHSKIALEYTRPYLDSVIMLPMEIVFLSFAESTMTQHMGERISQMVSRIVRGVVDSMKTQGFHHHQRASDVAGFFRGAGELLISYREIDHVPNGPYLAVHQCFQEPFHELRRFEGAQKVLVSVCSGEVGLPMDEYLRIGRYCRSELGGETDVVVMPFASSLRGDSPFVVLFGRDIIEKRRDGFDYPYAEAPPEKAPPRLPAYYRKFYGAVRRSMSHDISNF